MRHASLTPWSARALQRRPDGNAATVSRACWEKGLRRRVCIDEDSPWVEAGVARPLVQMVLGLFLLAAGLNVATAQYSLQIGNVTWTGSPGGYNCFSSTEYPNTVNFTLTKTGNGNRSYAVAAGPSTTTGNYNRQLRSGANRLDYQLYTSSARSFALKAPPTATANEVISGSSNAKSGTVLPLDFTFFIPPNQLVLPGIYTDQITVSVYRSYNDTRGPMDTRTITIRAVVISGAILSLVPTGSGFSGNTSQNLNFGTLTQDKSLGCDLLIRKNTSCNITFSSINSGVMKAIPTPTSDQVHRQWQPPESRHPGSDESAIRSVAFPRRKPPADQHHDW